MLKVMVGCGFRAEGDKLLNTRGSEETFGELFGHFLKSSCRSHLHTVMTSYQPLNF